MDALCDAACGSHRDQGRGSAWMTPAPTAPTGQRRHRPSPRSVPLRLRPMRLGPARPLWAPLRTPARMLGTPGRPGTQRSGRGRRRGHCPRWTLRDPTRHCQPARPRGWPPPTPTPPPLTRHALTRSSPARPHRPPPGHSRHRRVSPHRRLWTRPEPLHHRCDHNLTPPPALPQPAPAHLSLSRPAPAPPALFQPAPAGPALPRPGPNRLGATRLERTRLGPGSRSPRGTRPPRRPHDPVQARRRPALP